VLLVLHSFARRNRAWCSTRRLADITGATRQNVMLALRHLRETGWAIRSERHSDDGERLADEYELLLPGTIRTCADQVNAALSRKGGQPIEHELYQDGDIFAYNSGVHVREARIGQPVLESPEFRDLARRPATLRVYLLLAAYAPVREFVSAARMSREGRIGREATVREAYRWLGAAGLLRVEHRRRDKAQEGTPNLANGFTLIDPPSLGASRPVTGPTHACPTCGSAPKVETPAEVVHVLGTALESLPEEVRLVLDSAGDLRLSRSGDQLVLEVSHKVIADHLAIYAPDFRRAFGGPVVVRGADDKAAPPPSPTSGSSGRSLVQQFHAAVRHVPAALVTPTRREEVFAEELVARHGPTMARDIVSYALRQMARTKFDRVVGSFLAIRRYVPEAVAIFDGADP
jgi:biotin operon repressor